MKIYDLTVIIPTYNSEKYIERCVKSIQENNSTIQIIIINDGSTDRTERIINKLNEQYSNIKVIKLKNNQGVSVARNKGLKHVEGKYFTFLDSDDYIEKNAYDKIIKIAVNNNLDMCGYNYYEIKGKRIKSKYNYNNKILNNKELTQEILLDKISLVIWNKIYKTECYKSILFNEKLKLNEDYEYTIRCIEKTNKSMFINEYLYNYYHNNQSLTNNYICKQIKDNNHIKHLEKTIKNDLRKYKEYNYFISNENLKKIHLYSKCIDKQNRYKYLNENINKKQLKELLKYDIKKSTKIEIMIFSLSIRLHLMLFPIYTYIRNKIRR